MLVLTRKVGEKIVIGDNIVVTVVAIQGHKIRLGIDAPREINIARSELLEKLDLPLIQTHEDQSKQPATP
jgi:carbon storage regulator